MIVYISGPISNYLEKNYEPFAYAEDMLTKRGHEPLNPLRYDLTDDPDEKFSWQQYLRRDLFDVLRAEAVCVLPGAELSRGSTLELYVAHALMIPVLPVDAIEAGVTIL